MRGPKHKASREALDWRRYVGSRVMARCIGLATLALLVLVPSFGHASSFKGLGGLVLGGFILVFYGGLVVLPTLIFAIVCLAMRKTTPTAGKAARIGMFLAGATPLANLFTALLGIGDDELRVTAVVLLPLSGVAMVAFFLNRRLWKGMRLEQGDPDGAPLA